VDDRKKGVKEGEAGRREAWRGAMTFNESSKEDRRRSETTSRSAPLEK